MQNSKITIQNHFQVDKDEKDIDLLTNFKGSKIESCKTALKQILSSVNRLDQNIFKILKSLQKWKTLIAKTDQHKITVNFIKFSEDLSSELHKASLFINDIIQIYKIISNNTFKADDLIELMEMLLNESNKRICSSEGLEDDLDSIIKMFNNSYNSNMINYYDENRSIKITNNNENETIEEIYKEIKEIKHQSKLIIDFWNSHNCLIECSARSLQHHMKNSTGVLRISKVDYEELIDLWANVENKYMTDYTRINEAIVKVTEIYNTGDAISEVDSTLAKSDDLDPTPDNIIAGALFVMTIIYSFYCEIKRCSQIWGYKNLR
ncbi:11021_t:CDS:2 [Scutellospora calospora]|uniref:11021_t:CDS:1 n=1 Tax=Scutellospora calospora TaxID=85575 RepID=A0ACA9JY15_9GLOM|nr:11021_t:CDS:2 [Scutellospora calospora]